MLELSGKRKKDQDTGETNDCVRDFLIGVPGFRPVSVDTAERKELRAAGPPGLFSPGCNQDLVLRCASARQERGLAVMTASELMRTENDSSEHFQKMPGPYCTVRRSSGNKKH